MADARERIPGAIQRAVRQRCAFGCVVCGLPIYDYHHIIPYSKVKEHTQENLTLLCKIHHHEAREDVRLLTEAQVRKYDEKPYNRDRGWTSPYGINFMGSRFLCALGDNIFLSPKETSRLTTLIPISIDSVDLLNFDLTPTGELYFSGIILDRCNRPIFRCELNRIVYSSGNWDVTFISNRLLFRESKGKVMLEIIFAPPNKLIIPRGRIYCNGIEVIFTKEGLYVVNSDQLFVGNVTVAPMGIQIGNDSRGIPAMYPIGPTVERGYLSHHEARKRLRDRVRGLGL